MPLHLPTVSLKGTSWAPERGRSVAHARLCAGISQRQLAKRIGARRMTLMRIESGTTTPRPDVALALSRELKLPIEALLSPDQEEQGE